MTEYRAMRPECHEQFENLHRRIDKRDKLLSELENQQQSNAVSIARISEDVLHVTKSISALTKALWGLAASMLTTMAGFVLWYIQSL